MKPLNSLNPALVDPLSLINSLRQIGFRDAGGRPGLYERLTIPGVNDGHRRRLIIVPLNREMADFTELMSDALRQISTLEISVPSSAILTKTSLPTGDAYRFRRAEAEIGGSIPWLAGEELYTGARGVLLAGAKARVTQSPYFGPQNGRFAKRFLESVWMGQTEIGSFVVTAYAPSDELFAVSESLKKNPASLTRYSGREIGESIIESLKAVTDALTTYRQTKSLREFESGVSRGISRELTLALTHLSGTRSEAEISIIQADETTSLVDDSATSTAFVFTPSLDVSWGW